ncbi:MAG: hypothetical protein HQL51_01725 [Magnetococcales bacterium]|nr:hypothetical protein [Magnetococcales bacterium]
MSEPLEPYGGCNVLDFIPWRNPGESNRLPDDLVFSAYGWVVTLGNRSGLVTLFCDPVGRVIIAKAPMLLAELEEANLGKVGTTVWKWRSRAFAMVLRILWAADGGLPPSVPPDPAIEWVKEIKP